EKGNPRKALARKPIVRTLSKQQESSIPSLPEGLTSLSVAIQYSSDEIRTKGLLEALAKLPGMQFRTDKLAVRGVLHGRTSLKSRHVHFEVIHSKNDKRVVVEFELVAGPHGTTPTESAPLSTAIAQLVELIGSAQARGKALISGSFTFDLKRWQPTIPLPFS